MNAAIMDSSTARKEKSEILKSVLQEAEKDLSSGNVDRNVNGDVDVDELII